MARRIVEQEEALGPAFGEALKNVDRLVDLPEKIVGIEKSIAIFARLEDDPGFPDGYKMIGMSE